MTKYENEVSMTIGELPLIVGFLDFFGKDLKVSDVCCRIRDLYRYRRFHLHDNDATFVTFPLGNYWSSQNVDFDNLIDPLFEDQGLF